MQAFIVATHSNDLVVRWSRAAVAVVVIGVSVAMVILAIRDWSVEDSGAYWQAALRIREGLPLYTHVPDPGASEVYRYAPWFAYLWVPLTFLPEGLVLAAWTVLLLLASVAAVEGLAHESGLAPRLLAALFASILIWTAARGNVQPLMIFAMVTGLPRRSGPLWIALAASLKAVPIAFAVIYVARRDWKAAAWTVGMTAALVFPMPFMGWSPDDASPSLSLYYQLSPTVWAVVACASLAAATILALQRSKHSPVAAGVAAVLALPRLLIYDITFLAPSAVRFDGIRRQPNAPES